MPLGCPLCFDLNRRVFDKEDRLEGKRKRRSTSFKDGRSINLFMFDIRIDRAGLVVALFCFSSMWLIPLLSGKFLNGVSSVNYLVRSKSRVTMSSIVRSTLDHKSTPPMKTVERSANFFLFLGNNTHFKQKQGIYTLIKKTKMNKIKHHLCYISSYLEDSVLVDEDGRRESSGLLRPKNIFFRYLKLKQKPYHLLLAVLLLVHIHF